MRVIQDKKPEQFAEDCYGKKIQKGLRVAFNYQGSVRLGTIVELKRSEWKREDWRWSDEGKYLWDLKHFELYIQGDGIEKMSKIKNPDSFVIIE